MGSITLYMSVERDSYAPCMTECKQTASPVATVGGLPQSPTSENYYDPEGPIG